MSRKGAKVHITPGMCSTREADPPQPPTMHIRNGMKLRALQLTPVFSTGESHGQRTTVGYSPWGPTESDTTEVTEYVCMKLRADRTAKKLRIDRENA